MTKDYLIEKIKEVSKEDQISCKEAFNIATELDCTLEEVGNTCDKLNIKIVDCQLGCF